MSLDKIFVKRYKIGLKGSKRFDEFVKAKNVKEAIKIYKFKRGIFSNKDVLLDKKIINKR